MANETTPADSNVVGMMTEAQVREPKSTVGVYTLPCGFLDAEGVLHTEVALKEITGREEDMLASDKVPDSKKMTQLLLACVTRIGTITDRERLAQAIPELLIGDRLLLLIAIRRTSLGNNYPYNDVCPECEKPSLMNVNLADLDIVPMPEPLKRSYEARLPSKAALLEWSDNGELPAAEKTAPTGHTVKFRCSNGRDEEKFSKTMNEAEALSQTLKARIELLDGKPPSIEALQELNFNERAWVRELFDAADGGVETTLDVTCPKCEADYKRELDIKQMGFFFPSRVRRNSKIKSST